jgi:DNA-binding NarL/FixJ family response regulator
MKSQVDTIRVLIADDHPLWVDGLVRALEKEYDIEYVGCAQDGIEVVRMAGDLNPNVVILDIDMPKMNGLEAASQIKSLFPTISILIVSAFQYESYINACFEMGLEGYMLKNSSRTELMNAIRMVHAGDSVFSQKTIKVMLQKTKTAHDLVNSGSLGNREIQIIMLAAKGLTNKEIAKLIKVSEHTISSHFRNIYRKLRVKSRAEAVAFALREGIINMSSLHEPISDDNNGNDF